MVDRSKRYLPHKNEYSDAFPKSSGLSDFVFKKQQNLKKFKFLSATAYSGQFITTGQTKVADKQSITTSLAQNGNTFHKSCEHGELEVLLNKKDTSCGGLSF